MPLILEIEPDGHIPVATVIAHNDQDEQRLLALWRTLGPQVRRLAASSSCGRTPCAPKTQLAAKARRPTSSTPL